MNPNELNSEPLAPTQISHPPIPDADPAGTSPIMDCPPEAILKAAATGTADTIVLDDLGIHLDRCPACLEKIQILIDEYRTAKTGEIPPESLEVANLAISDQAASSLTEYPSLTWDKSTDPMPGRYRIGRCLGQGGIGRVYEATDKVLGRTVAVKRLRFELMTPQSLEHFEREARVQATLNHPNIVAIHEFGQHQGFPFLVMELVDGAPLSTILRKRPLSPRMAARLLIPIARAIAHAHSKGLVHRDLKPSNILIASGHGSAPVNPGATHETLVDDSSIPKIADFGLARIYNEGQTTTRNDSLIGTVAYLAPERITSTESRFRPVSDTYALGVILYECLTGRPPFQADEATQTLAMIKDLDPVPPRILQPAIPRDLETICLKCIAKEPGDRYATADEFADDLNRFLDDRPIHARPLSTPARIWRWCRRHPGTAASIVFSIVSMIAMATGGWIAAGVQAELRAAAQRNLEEARRNAIAAENARISAEKRRALAQSQFMNGTSAIHRLGLTIDTYASNKPEIEAFTALRKAFREEIVKLVENFLRETGDSDESPTLMARVQGTGVIAHAMSNNFDRAETLFRQLEESVARAEAQNATDETIRFFVINAAMSLGDSYDRSGRLSDALRVASRCWDRWPVDTDDPDTSLFMIQSRRELAFLLRHLQQEDRQIQKAAEFEKRLAEFDKVLERKIIQVPLRN